MAKLTDLNQRIEAAACLARDIAPDIDVVLITHYPDIETLDTLRPGETDLHSITATNRAVAVEMLDAGVEVFVQRADRAAFRRWMSGRDDTPQNRRAWIDRNQLLRGAAALQVLGLRPSAAPPPRPHFATAPGPLAERLLEAFDDEESGAFDDLVQALMAEGRSDVLDLAIRKLGERDGEEAGDELNRVLREAAEGAATGPSGWAELVALVVALPAGELPDGEELARELVNAGAVADSDELRLLPGWRSPDALTELSFVATRRLLLDLVAGKPPRDLPPGDTDDLARLGFGVLIGLRIDWDIPVWEEIAAADDLTGADAQEAESDEDAGETQELARRTALFDHWRGRVFEQSGGCVPLGLVRFSHVAEEMADFLEAAGEQTGGLEEIRAFVGTCRAAAGDDDVVCRLQAVAGGLELSLYTASGHFLDSLTMPAGRLPARADEMASLIGAFVRVMPDDPGQISK